MLLHQALCVKETGVIHSSQIAVVFESHIRKEKGMCIR